MTGRARFASWSRPEVRVRVVTPPPVEQVSLEQAYRQMRLTPYGSPLAHPDDDWLAEWIPVAREMCEDETGRSFAPQTLEATIERWPTSGSCAGSSTSTRRPYVELPGSPVTEIISITFANDVDVTDEVLPEGIVADDTYDLGTGSGWTNTGITDLVLTDSADTPLTLVADTDYTLDAATGRITFLGTVPGVQPYVAAYSVTESILDADQYALDDVAVPNRVYPIDAWPAATKGPNAIRVRYTAGYDLDDTSPPGTHPLPKKCRGAMLLLLAHFYENREQTTDVELMELPRGVSTMLAKEKIDLGMA